MRVLGIPVTLVEIEEASRRFEVAGLLSEGETYRAIANKTGISTATVTRIAHWFHHGTGGYRRALHRVGKE